MDNHDAAVTLCGAAAAGVFLIALAARLRVPSIAVLLLGGIILGPEVLGWIQPSAIASELETVVTLTVAIILFEGGLTLDIRGFLREPRVILRMLTLGVVLTWLGTASVIYIIYPEANMQLAVMAASLVIVTGPTVVSPLLRRINLQSRLHHILYWEGVWVDAVGVFVAVLCFEWIASASDVSWFHPLGRFASRFVIGAGIGAITGLAAGLVLKRRWVGTDHANIVVLGTALLALALANAVLPESGILAVIVSGLVVSLHRAPQLKQLKRFELELTEIGIGLLFVLLAAKLELARFFEDGLRLVFVLFAILFILRPVNVLVATWGEGFRWRERAFLAWLAPRGIVAASMASLFTLRLEKLGHPQASLLETVTYAVIGTTVLVQGLTAPALARGLGLQRKHRSVWLLIGDPDLAVEFHRRLRQAGGRSLVFAADEKQAKELLDEDVDAITSNPLVPSSIHDPRIEDAEAVLALSSCPETNDRICAVWSEVLGPSACYRWDGVEAARLGPGQALWTDLPTPIDVRAKIEAGTHALDTLDVGPAEDLPRFGEQLTPLLYVDDGQIVAADHELPPEVPSVVVLRRRIPGLCGLVRDAIIIDQPHPTFESTVDALLDLAAAGTPNLAKDVHRKDILEMERTMPTAVGGGIAIPHVYDAHVRRSTAYVARIAGGLSDRSPDGTAIRLVFLLVSPTDRAPEHLQSLAALAQLARDPNIVAVLTRQHTRSRLLALLHEHE